MWREDCVSFMVAEGAEILPEDFERRGVEDYRGLGREIQQGLNEPDIASSLPGARSDQQRVRGCDVLPERSCR